MNVYGNPDLGFAQNDIEYRSTEAFIIITKGVPYVFQGRRLPPSVGISTAAKKKATDVMQRAT